MAREPNLRMGALDRDSHFDGTELRRIDLQFRAVQIVADHPTRLGPRELVRTPAYPRRRRPSESASGRRRSRRSRWVRTPAAPAIPFASVEVSESALPPCACLSDSTALASAAAPSALAAALAAVAAAAGTTTAAGGSSNPPARPAGRAAAPTAAGPAESSACGSCGRAAGNPCSARGRGTGSRDYGLQGRTAIPCGVTGHRWSRRCRRCCRLQVRLWCLPPNPSVPPIR